MMKIPWTQHASNEQILGMMDESRSLRKRQKNWMCLKTRLLITEGHRRKVSGKENLRKTIRAMLLDALMQEDEESKIDYAKLKEKARQKLGVTETEPAFGQRTLDRTGSFNYIGRNY